MSTCRLIQLATDIHHRWQQHYPRSNFQNTTVIRTAASSSSSSSSSFSASDQQQQQEQDNSQYSDTSIYKDQSLEATTTSSPDLILQGPLPGSTIAVFGCIHADPDDASIGDYILRHRPSTVVVETALNDVHGSATGNVAHLQDFLRMTPSHAGAVDARTRALASIGAQLSASPDPINSPIWMEVSASPMFYSEHLAYIAAFAVQSKLVYGDRPKEITYQRMLNCPTLADLDSAFGLQSAANYHDLVAHMQLPKDLDSPSLAEKVLIQERDAVLLKSLHDASCTAGQNSLVVGVVGSSHLAGMHQLWKNEAWKEIIASGITELPENTNKNKEEDPSIAGVRRALFEGVIRLTCRADVTADIFETLGQPEGAAWEVYCMTSEIYGSSRMLLATLNRDQLAEVCSGWRCDMWSILEPLRNIRPVNGGCGYDEEMVIHLRQLNFELQM